MANNSTNVKPNNYLSNIIEHKKKATTQDVVNTDLGLGQSPRCGRVKLI